MRFLFLTLACYSAVFRHLVTVCIPLYGILELITCNTATLAVLIYCSFLCRTWHLIVLGASELEFPFATVSDAHKTLVLKWCHKKGNYATNSRCGKDQRVHRYPDILHFSQFCLVLDHSSAELLDSMMMVGPHITVYPFMLVTN